MLHNNYGWQVLPILLLVLMWRVQKATCEIEDNTINEDGSFSFRHSNDDIGGYYHSASGTPDNIVRGRYGSRNPASGQVEEVVYTAGPRGFRANGPKIHRKMDLAQYPVRPIGTPFDPLADLYDDPSYSFSYRTPDQSRTEDNDATGRIRGLYSYIDDVGERHSVRYAAGARTGFEVVNSVPDNPSIVGYSSPLYKAHPKTRGKMSVQRGPDGTYKLIAAGPDHRRAESRAPDGLVRGTYSFLDDKGVQRTVEYIAGAGIGYRVVQNVIGPGTHINPSVSDFRLSDTDFRLANDFGRGAGGPITSRVGASATTNRRRVTESGGGGGAGIRGDELPGSVNDDADLNSMGNDYLKKAKNRPGDSNSKEKDPSSNYGGVIDVRTKSDRMGSAANTNRGTTRYRGGSNGMHPKDVPNRRMPERERVASPSSSNRGGMRPPNNRNTMNMNDDASSGNWERDRESFSSSGGYPVSNGGSSGNSYNYDAPLSPNNYNFNDDDVAALPPLITPNRKLLDVERDRDWAERHRDSTLIKNVGKWYIGLPPGQSVRAHVQNIDLLPSGGRRVQSPSEALRQDEIADMVDSYDGDTRQRNNS